MLTNYMKCRSQAIVLSAIFCASIATAGSFDDFFAATKRNDSSTILTLLLRGFDANTQDAKGDTPLLIAAREPSPKVIDVLLLAPGLKPDVRNNMGETPLMLAALTGNAGLARRLVALDADVNKTGWTPLHYAATNGHTDIMNLLLDRHAYIDAESPNGSTPLMMAAMYGSPEAVKLLVEAGADTQLKNEQGMTALDFALTAKRPDAERMLRASATQPSPKPMAATPNAAVTLIAPQAPQPAVKQKLPPGSW